MYKLILIVALVLAGCGSGTGPGPGKIKTGSWTGTWTNVASGGGTISLSIEQSGSGYTGPIAMIGGSHCYESGVISASVSSNKEFGGNLLFDGKLLVLFKATFQGNEMDGTWSNFQGAVSCCSCPADSGTWKVSQ